MLRSMRWGWTFVIGSAFVASGACIALIDKNADQCDTNADCAAKGPAFANRVCTRNVCVSGSVSNDSGADVRDSSVDVGADTATDSDASVDSGIEAGEAGDAGDPDAGVFVASGTTLSGSVLVAIDPLSGSELTRETMDVSAIAYDPGFITGEGDVWYVFEDDTTPTDAGLPSSKLCARRFDPATRTWTELGALAGVPKPKSPNDVLLMNKRIIYMAPYIGADPLGVGNVFLIDVSSPVAPKLVCASCGEGPANVVKKASSTETYLGMLVGGRGNDTFTGGTLGVGFIQACTDTGGTCPRYFQRYRYTGNDGTDIPGSQEKFGSFASDVTVGLGTSYRHKAALMVVPETATKGKVIQNSQTFFIPGDVVGTFDYTGRATFSPAVVAGCDDVVLFTTFSNRLHAVPYSATGLSAVSIEGESASQLAFDSRTKVVASIANGLKAARLSTTPTLSLTALSWPVVDFTPKAIKGRELAKICLK
jgi:hypothetical protein